MKRLITILFAAFFALQALAQHDEFPVYRDFSIPKPDRSTKVTEADFKLTDRFIALYPEGLPVASQETLYKLYDFYKNDPLGQAEWKSMQASAVRIISSWNIQGTSGFGNARYIKSLGALSSLAKLYVFTGNELLSLFIRGHLAKMAAYPMDFWVHAELRGLKDPKAPVGGLETAAVCRTLAYALMATKKDMGPEELKTIETAYLEGAHKPNRRWLNKFRPNNWTAAVASGMLYSAKYFGDAEARQRAIDAIRYYVTTAIGPDGSYAEGYGYFNYPVSLLFSAALVMTPDEIRSCFGDCALRNSMAWRVYGHMTDLEPKGKSGIMRISFGDNPYGDYSLRAVDGPARFCELVFQDGIAAWLRQKYGAHLNVNTMLLSEKLGNPKAEPKSPQEAGLPLTKAFDSGDCFIRSSWDDDAIVFCMRAGDGGKRVGYAHNRPDLNGIALGAFGEYLIVTPGSASYRSTLHNEYDILTRSSNTITIDGKNQKRPGSGTYKKGRWDSRPFWVSGIPYCPVKQCEILPDGSSILRTDASKIYHVEMESASRSVRFIPEGGFFIVRDVMNPTDGEKHLFDYRLHIFNRDGKTVVSGKPGALKLERPMADLYIALKSAAKVKLLQEDGYMHGPKDRDYDEGGPGQGKPGSAIELDWQSNAAALDICAVLYPKHPGEPAPKIKFGKGKVTVDGKTYDIPE
ncbi:MAG: heparinase II/III family protein [Bacteroidales bacterium]|nr:heparinase II/III family protein [Bacteroidales bacterium]